MLRFPLLIAASLVATPLAVAAGPGPGSDLDRVIRARFGEAVQVHYHPSRTTPRRISGLRAPTEGHDLGERARRFILAHRDILGLESDVAVEEVRTFTPPDPRMTERWHTVRLAQRWRGLPVEGRQAALRIDGDGHVISLTSDLGPLAISWPERTITAEEAVAQVERRYHSAAIGSPKTVVVARATLGRVAWKVPLAAIPLQAHFFVWLDAESGEVIKEAPAGFDQIITEPPRREGGQ